MHQNILPPNNLTLSERFLYFGYVLLLCDLALLAVGAFLHVPWIVGGIAALLVWREVVKRRRDPGPTSGIHGTGHFATDDEIAQAGMSGRSDGLIIGTLPPSTKPQLPIVFQIAGVRKNETAKIRKLFYRLVFKKDSSGRYVLPNMLRLPCTDKMSHLACYMPSGVGKTWGVVITNLIVNAENENALVYDPSGEAYRETAEFRRRHFGHEIRLIDPFGVCGATSSDSVNVFDQVGPDDPGCFDYCNHLAHALVVEKPNSNQDPFWHDGTVGSTGFVLHSIARNARGKLRSLLSLGELLDGKRLHDLAKSYADHPDEALRRGANHMLNYQGKTLQSMLACATTAHAWMNSPAFSQALSNSTFDVRDLQRRKMTLYVVIPGHRVAESRPFVRTILTAILYAAFEAGPDIRRLPLRFFLDEAATLGANLDLLTTLYMQGRKFGLRSISFFQSVGQVAEIAGGPEKVQNFRAQMAGELWKPKDFASAKEVSDWIGNTTVRTTSNSWQEGTNSGWSNSQGNQISHGRSGGTNAGSTTSVSETGVLAIRPEEIIQLREREAIFTSAGTPPIMVNVIQAAEARGFGDVSDTRQQQQRYLFRIRCHAAALLLGVVPFWTAAAMTVFVTGGVQRSRPAVGVQQQVEQMERFHRTQQSRQYRPQQQRW